ncbi:MAG: hypothetical protein Kow00127_04940 [Bacteroidales bacterium]
MNRYIIAGFIFLMIFLAGCFKEDDPLPAYPVQQTTIPMGKYYRYQIWFDLAENRQVEVVDKNTYDLGFAAADTAWQIIMNTSAFMLAGNTGLTDLSVPVDTTGLPWQFEPSSGPPDSTAFGNWLSITNGDTVYTGEVYVINRGFDHVGNYRGLIKVRFEYVDQQHYRFSYANLDGTDIRSAEISKQDSTVYTWFSFDTETEVDAGPAADTWDLLFTQYTTLLYTNTGTPYPYLVTGVLSNWNATWVAMDSVTGYDNIDLQFALSQKYSNRLDFIGYDWKELEGDVNTGNVYYEIVPNRTYLIRNRNGLYFKLRFLNFYNDQGEKGYPAFQYDVL